MFFGLFVDNSDIYLFHNVRNLAALKHILSDFGDVKTNYMPGDYINLIFRRSGSAAFAIFLLDIAVSTSVLVISFSNSSCTGFNFFESLVKKRDWVLESFISCLYRLA